MIPQIDPQRVQDLLYKFAFYDYGCMYLIIFMYKVLR